MTKSIKLIVAVGLILFITPITFAQYKQNCSNYNTTRNIELDDSSSNEVVKVEVKDNAKHLMIGVNSTISSGSLTMEIFDPKGNKQGNFSVESMMSSNSNSKGKNKETVCGQLNKSFQDPMKGEWTIKLKPKKVSGKININSHQIQ
jgi:hypothetical protein